MHASLALLMASARLPLIKIKLEVTEARDLLMKKETPDLTDLCLHRDHFNLEKRGLLCIEQH